MANYLIYPRRNRYAHIPVGAPEGYIATLVYLGGENIVPFSPGTTGNNYFRVSSPSYSQITESPILYTTANANTTIDISYNSTVGSPTGIQAYANLGNVIITIDILNTVITKTAHGLANNTQIFFTTTGALPSPLKIGSYTSVTPNSNTYYVITSNANTFGIATSPQGVTLGTFGTQSGTHYVYYRTVPPTI